MASPRRQNLLLSLWPLLLLLLASEDSRASEGGGGDGDNDNDDRRPPLCSRVPHSFDPTNRNLVSHRYNATRESLFLDFSDLLHKFCDDDVYNTSVAGAFRY